MIFSSFFFPFCHKEYYAYDNIKIVENCKVTEPLSLSLSLNRPDQCSGIVKFCDHMPFCYYFSFFSHRFNPLVKCCDHMPFFIFVIISLNQSINQKDQNKQKKEKRLHILTQRTQEHHHRKGRGRGYP